MARGGALIIRGPYDESLHRDTVLDPVAVPARNHRSTVPIKPIVVCKAGMGLGKTKALKDLIAAEARKNSDIKVLIVTFSRSLASKMAQDFAKLGF